MEEQRRRIGLKQLGGFTADCHQGIGDQQGTTGPVQAAEFLKAAQTEVERPERKPRQLIVMGKALLAKHTGAAGREAQPGGRQGKRKTPLPRCDPHLRRGEGPGHGRHRQLVLKARGGGQHDRSHGAMLLLEIAQGPQHLPGRSDRGVKQEAVAQARHRHADRHGHIENALQLLKAPELARDQLPHQGAAAPVGVERQQRPPGPTLIGGIASLCHLSVAGHLSRHRSMTRIIGVAHRGSSAAWISVGAQRQGHQVTRPLNPLESPFCCRESCRRGALRSGPWRSPCRACRHRAPAAHRAGEGPPSPGWRTRTGCRQGGNQNDPQSHGAGC